MLSKTAGPQQCAPAPLGMDLPRKTMLSDKVMSLKAKLEPDIVLFRLSLLSTTDGSNKSTTPTDTHEDVVGDWRLARFLQSVEGDVEEAVKAVQNHLKWRASVNAERIRKQVLGLPFRISSCPHALHLTSIGLQKPCVNAGLSRLGDLVHLETLGSGAGNGEIREMIKRTNETQLLEHYVGFFELRSAVLESLSASAGRIVRSVQIRDMSNFGLNMISERSALATLQSIVKVGSENYPESTAYAIFTRAPAMFTSVWNIVSKVLPARTVKKVRFVTHADTPSTLMRYIQPESIVALQRLTWGDDGDSIADDVETRAVKCFEKTVQVSARGTEYLFVALTSGQKCSFRIFDSDDGCDLTQFADILYVHNNQWENVVPDDVVVHTDTPNAKGFAACPDCAYNCLVVITCDNSSSWFSSKSMRVDVQVC